MKKIGLTIGKFAPLHKGHQYLIETALKEMDEFYIMVYETEIIDISLEKRAGWIEKLYPNAKIIYATGAPKEYGMTKELIKIQTDYILEKTKGINITHFYSSEEYGKYAALALDAEDRRVDQSRSNIPINAGKIREDLEKYRPFLEDIVYKDIKRS